MRIVISCYNYGKSFILFRICSHFYSCHFSPLYFSFFLPLPPPSLSLSFPPALYLPLSFSLSLSIFHLFIVYGDIFRFYWTINVETFECCPIRFHLLITRTRKSVQQWTRYKQIVFPLWEHVTVSDFWQKYDRTLKWNWRLVLYASIDLKTTEYITWTNALQNRCHTCIQ